MTAATVVQATTLKNQIVQKVGYYSTPAVVMDNSGLQDIAVLDVEGLVRLACTIIVATNALAAFAIAGLFHQGDNNGASPPVYNWVTLRNATAQFTTPTGILLDASGDLTVQAPGRGWFVLEVAGLTKIKIQANSSAIGGSSLTVFGGAV